MHCSRVDAFRHRADPIFVDRAGEGHFLPRLTLTGARSAKRETGFTCKSPRLLRRKRVPRDKGHPPRIIPDIERRARGAKSAARKFGDHLVLTVTLQADPAAQ